MRPAAANRGTTVEVRDLFFSTPARLKFMKGERAEGSAITDIVKRIAIAFPAVRFTLAGSDRSGLDYLAADQAPIGQLRRIGDVVGADFAANAVEIDAMREGVAARRPRLAAQLFARQRAAAICLCQRPAGARPADRRRDSRRLRRHAGARPPCGDRAVPDARSGLGRRQRASGQGRCPLPRSRAGARPDRRRDPRGAGRRRHQGGDDGCGGDDERLPHRPDRLCASRTGQRPPLVQPGFPRRIGGSGLRFRALAVTPARPGFQRSGWQWQVAGSARRRRPSSTPGRSTAATPAPARRRSTRRLLQAGLGAARAQIHENYIVAQTRDSLIIVDQHAAHERLVYEALKQAMEARPLPAQMLLLPEIVDLPEDDVSTACRACRDAAGASGSASSASARAPSRCARRLPCSARPTCSRWSATLPTRSPTTTPPTR